MKLKLLFIIDRIMYNDEIKTIPQLNTDDLVR